MILELGFYSYKLSSTPEDRAAVFALFDSGNGSVNGSGLADCLRTLGFTVSLLSMHQTIVKACLLAIEGGAGRVRQRTFLIRSVRGSLRQGCLLMMWHDVMISDIGL